MKPVNFYNIELVASVATGGSAERFKTGGGKLSGLRFHSISITAKPRAKKSFANNPIPKPAPAIKDCDLDEVFRRTLNQLSDFKGDIETESVDADSTITINKNPRVSAGVESFGLHKKTAKISPIPAEEGVIPTVAQPRILIVEDDDSVSYYLLHMLQQKGFSVKIARDGRQAVEFMGRIAPPDIIVLDVMLPFLNGFELIERFRKDKLWKNVPIIMLTSKDNQTDIVRAFDGGANDYIQKPFQSKEFLARISRFL
ncbi:MAG: response regulator transcription factor [Pyrinomonadaceae bacterium]